MTQAQKEIEDRGETPFPLSVKPGGAELANPTRAFEAVQTSRQEPDPLGQIIRDEQGLIEVETTVVPAALLPGSSGRIYVVFRPGLDKKTHWNNEVEDLVFWIDPPTGWQVDSRYLTVKRPPEAVSQEDRKVEFELKCPTGFTGSANVAAYALYYICEGVNGECLYRRRDVPLRIDVGETP